jgi:hypothetical protein
MLDRSSPFPTMKAVKLLFAKRWRLREAFSEAVIQGKKKVEALAFVRFSEQRKSDQECPKS